MDEFGMLSIVLLLGSIQGLILTFLLLGVKKENKSANRFLALFLFLISVTMIGRLLLQTSIFENYPSFLALPDAIIFLYGPLMYFHLKKLLLKSRVSNIQLLICFTPVCLFALSQIPLMLSPDHSLHIFWRKYTRFRYIILEGSAIAHNIYFFILQVKLLFNYQKTSNNNFSFRQHPHYLWILYRFVGLALLMWLIAYFSWVFRLPYFMGINAYLVVWIVLPMITYLIGYFAMKNPDFYKVTITKRNQYKKVIPDKEKEIILEAIIDAMENKKWYKNPEFSLSYLSENLNIDRNKLSQLINNEFNKNFNDWTNTYRIMDSKAALLNSDLSIKEVFYDVGFNSKSAFNKAFKKNVGKTPSEFRIDP